MCFTFKKFRYRQIYDNFLSENVSFFADTGKNVSLTYFGLKSK